MTASTIMLLFVWAMHGYATARDNGEMKFASGILSVVPFVSDLVFRDTNGYVGIVNQPTWITLVELLIAIGILGISWVIGYAIGSWRNQ